MDTTDSWALPDEYVMLAATVRRFMERDVRPAEDKMPHDATNQMDLRASRLLVYQAAWSGDAGKDIKIDASVAKVFATEAANRVVDRCMQILSGMGMTHELPMERWYRELRIRRVGEGPSEVQRIVIARDMLSGRSKSH